MTHKDLTKGKKKKVHLMLTEAIVGELEKHREHGVSKSWTARRALALYLAGPPRDDLATQYEAELERIGDALEHCGIGGIYAEFDDAADAIQQMARYIKGTSLKLGPVFSVLRQAKAAGIESADAALKLLTAEMELLE